MELIHRLRSGVNRGATRDAEHEDAPNFPQPDLGMLVASPDITARAAAMASTVCFCRDLDVQGVIEALIDIKHNYVESEEHFGEPLFVHRKGAVRVGLGQKGLVPGSMGTSSFLS